MFEYEVVQYIKSNIVPGSLIFGTNITKTDYEESGHSMGVWEWGMKFPLIINN